MSIIDNCRRVGESVEALCNCTIEFTTIVSRLINGNSGYVGVYVLLEDAVLSKEVNNNNFT